MSSQYKKLAHSLWLCKYHIIFCPKYRKKVLTNKREVIVRNLIYKLCAQKDGVVVEEVNIQEDHVHLMVSIPPKIAVSDFMGFLKGKIALTLFQYDKNLSKMFWGKHFWSRGYCVSTIGLDEEKIKKYIKWSQDVEPKG